MSPRTSLLAVRGANAVARALRTHGYAVIDDAIDAASARAMRDEMRALFRANAFKANATVFVSGATQFALEKRGIYECETHALSDAHGALAPMLTSLGQGRELMADANALLGWKDADAGSTTTLTHASVKLQVNIGDGACFPLHFDSDGALDSRRLTMLTYLNEDWKVGDGGELVVYPFPEDAKVIEPRFGRVVLLSSQLGLHRVMPSSAKERLMFTVWFFARDKVGEARAPAPGTTAESQMSALLHPALRKHLCKLVLADTWAQSIEEAHPDDEARAAALKTHWDEVGLIGRVLSNNYPLGLTRIAENISAAKTFPPIAWF